MKNWIVLSFLLVSVALNSQTIELRESEFGTPVNGQTLYVSGSPSNELRKDFWFSQSSGAVMNMRAKRYELTIGDMGIHHTFLWLVGYMPLSPLVVNPLVAVNVWPVASDTVLEHFNAYYYPNYTIAKSKFRYVLFDDDNPLDSAFVDVVFDTSPNTVDSHSFGDVNLSAYPNPTFGKLTVSYGVEGSIDNSFLEVYSILGEKVLSKRLETAQGNIDLDLSDVEPGVYFYKVKAAGKTIKSERFILK